jgi:hypothetical protein
MEQLPAYLDRIQECFPNLTISDVRSNGDGLVNDIVIVNDELVFRFPKSDRARTMLAHEASLLDLVHTHQKTSRKPPALAARRNGGTANRTASACRS